MSVTTRTIKLTKHSPQIRKHNRQITQKLKPIENKLKKRLLLFYNQNIKGSLTPIEILRPKYEIMVNNFIRNTIYESYFHGSDRVVSQLHKDYSYMNVQVRDFDNINAIVDEQSSAFWTTAGKLKWREIEIQKPDFQAEAAMIGYAAYTTYHAFNTAVLSKGRDVMALNEDTNKIAARTHKSIIAEEFRNFAGRVVFTTQHDARVDPVFCGPLDGNIYDLTDPDIPTPPLHLHCRCVLTPVIDIMM